MTVAQEFLVRASRFSSSTLPQNSFRLWQSSREDLRSSIKGILLIFKPLEELALAALSFSPVAAGSRLQNCLLNQAGNTIVRNSR